MQIVIATEMTAGVQADSIMGMAAHAVNDVHGSDCLKSQGMWWVCVTSWSQECPSRVAYLWVEVGGGEVGAHGHPPRPDVVVLPKQLQPSPP